MTDAMLRRVSDTIARARRVLVTSHPSPDGDAVGCIVATALALEGRGQTVVAYNPDPIPRRFRFLEGSERITSALPAEPCDVTVVLDCSDSRMFPGGEPPWHLLGTVLVIDHHKTQGSLGHLVYRDPSAAAVGVLLHRVFSYLAVELTVPVAEALYCSILSDTGSFRYQNTDPEAMRVAAELLEVGVDPWRVASHIYETRPKGELELLALVLRTLQVAGDGMAASLTVSPEMLTETGCTSDMVDGFINYARGIDGVEVAVLLRPDPGGVRVSMRSRGTVDVSEIAQQFGGGGHRNAAGCTLPLGMGEVRAQVFEAVGQYCRDAGLLPRNGGGNGGGGIA
ncbi:MAG: bifunctional oligoribonuclease/PAP phosphatase NrnA [Deltaproteobacteria bacterium]|nr:bifunctional oligoribonuclease/PAP phosphatase NrnA [Deltaproteobacteria bacterium]